MVPTAPPPLAAAVPGALRVSVLPEAVVLVVGAGGVVAAGRAGRGAGREAAGFGVVVRIGGGRGRNVVELRLHRAVAVGQLEVAVQRSVARERGVALAIGDRARAK